MQSTGITQELKARPALFSGDLHEEITWRPQEGIARETSFYFIFHGSLILFYCVITFLRLAGGFGRHAAMRHNVPILLFRQGKTFRIAPDLLLKKHVLCDVLE